MKENIKLVLKGFVIGIGKIIPGVSGAMLAITLGVYEKGLKIVSNFTKEIKPNFKFTICLGFGMLLSIILGSNVVMYCLNNYYLPTMLLFIGMIVGGLKPLFQEIKYEKVKLKNVIICCIVIIAILALSLLDFGNDKTNYTKSLSSFFMFFIGGILDATATVIPGISGTALLMILGYYNIIMNTFGDILNFSNITNNLFVLIPFCFGMLLGIIYIAKLMNYLFSKHKNSTYYAIIGFALTSIVLLFMQTTGRIYSVSEIIISLIMLVLGYFIAKKLDK